MFVIHYLESSLDFSTTQPSQSKHVNNKTSFTGSYAPGMQPALEGRKAGGRWRLCLLFSDNRYLVFYVTLLYRSLKPGRAARLHLPICSRASWTRGRDVAMPHRPTAPRHKRGHPSPAWELGGIAGKPRKTDLNMTQSLAGRGVLGDGMAALLSESHGVL